MNYSELMDAARKQDEAFEAVEVEVGTLPLRNAPLIMQLKTAMAAIEAGIVLDDFSTVAEGQVILERIVKILT